MEEVIDLDRVIMETQEIFKYLDDEIYSKIPDDIKKPINEFKGKYHFTYDKTKELNEQKISQSTKDLIVGLYYKYAANEEGKKAIIENIEKNEARIAEEEKRLKEKYSVDKLFSNNNITKQNESQPVPAKKESIIKSIINKILVFFRKGKNNE